ncbi:MAG TPA: hypothetical protein VMJ32_00195 [Pirellulales bacterium]|nr:hypothetical protein [Pirellulales bacterium]
MQKPLLNSAIRAKNGQVVASFGNRRVASFLVGGVAILAISGKMLDSLLVMRVRCASPKWQQLFPRNGFVTDANR